MENQFKNIMRDSGGSTQINAKNTQTSHEQVQETILLNIIYLYF